jgi:hypothetical protein
MWLFAQSSLYVDAQGCPVRDRRKRIVGFMRVRCLPTATPLPIQLQRRRRHIPSRRAALKKRLHYPMSRQKRPEMEPDAAHSPETVSRNVRWGSKPEVTAREWRVRFTLKSGLRELDRSCPKRAMSDRSNGMQRILDDSTGAVSSIPPINHTLAALNVSAVAHGYGRSPSLWRRSGRRLRARTQCQ